ncbi:MAG: AAA family ATPase [Paracoccaceae bacterium]
MNRLDLTRYGRFKDVQIKLPLPPADTSDVTVIYGPNEAGKSTAFTAYLELLFGMKARDHPYEFQFKRSDLLVGAELALPNRAR